MRLIREIDGFWLLVSYTGQYRHFATKQAALVWLAAHKKRST